MAARIVEVRKDILKKNDLLARDLRAEFEKARVAVVGLVSSPGSGKTTLLERTATELGRRYKVGILVGDLATDNDAKRLSRSGAKVHQIVTGTVCHLEAQMVATALEGWDLHSLDFLFIENVGNLVCPSSYDLGEALRAVLVSVAEGEDKPLKYPTIFNTADMAVVTKIDLADAVGVKVDDVVRNIHEVRPGLEVFETSARTGQGMNEWVSRLEMIRAS